MRKAVLLLLLSGSLCMADTLITRDGARHDGMLESSNDQYVVFNESGMPHRYDRTNVREVEFNSAGMPSSANRGYDNDDRYRNNGQYSNNNNGQYNNGQYNSNGQYNNNGQYSDNNRRNDSNYGPNGRGRNYVNL